MVLGFNKTAKYIWKLRLLLYLNNCCKLSICNFNLFNISIDIILYMRVFPPSLYKYDININRY